MTKRNLTIWLLAVVTISAGMVKVAAAEKQTQQQPKQLQEQTEQIEKYIAQRRQAIEDFYPDQLTELRLQAEAEIIMLEVVDKAVYARLDKQAEVAETVLQINGYENVPHGRFEVTTETAPRRFAAAQSRISEVKNDILAKYEFGAISLEKGKRYALTVSLPQLEKRLKENLLKPKPKTTYGVITGLLYSGKKPSALIDGAIVHQADTIHGARVVKINVNTVEFEKKGRRWKQKIREMPKARWK